MMRSLGLRVVGWPDVGIEPAGVKVSTGPASSIGRSSRLDPELITLSEFFELWVWPQVLRPAGRSERTRSDYLTSLAYWERLTGSPTLVRITRATCTQFADALPYLPADRRRPDGPRIGPNTVRNHLTNIQRVLDWTGPESRSRPKQAGLLAEPPWFVLPRQHHPPPKRPFELDHLARWLEVLPTVARNCPQNVLFPPAAWWRAVILLGYNSGARSGTLFRLRWEWLLGHLLQVPDGAIKGISGRLIYLNRPALAAIEPLKQPTGLILGWEAWPVCESTLTKHRRQQQAAAGIPPYALGALRRAFATQAARINPLAAQIQMGHVGPGFAMIANHYLDHATLLGDALERLRQP